MQNTAYSKEEMAKMNFKVSHNTLDSPAKL